MSSPASLRARIDDRMARIAVIGLGYVGLPVATRAAEVGYEVVGYDVSEQRVSALANGASYVEDISDDIVAESLASGFRPTTDPADLAGFDVAIITVPTPLREGNPDLAYVEEAGRSVAAALRPGALVVLESTTYPGTTTELLAPILEEGSGLRGGEDFHLGYSPERIDPGNTAWNLVTTPKVVSGIDGPSTDLVAAFYGSIVDKVVVMGSTAEAELVKLLENTFRHVNIALVNEIAMFAGSLGVNVWNVIDAASTKPYGYMRFTPGPGVGGHCLPIDPSYLSWQVKRRSGRSFRFVELANDVNEHMPDHVVSRLIAMLNRAGRAVRGTRFLLLGVAYKASTSDFRESPSLHVAEALRALGGELQVCDPHVTELDRDRLGMPLVDLDAVTLAASDVVVVLVDHPEFEPDLIARHAPLVFDAKGILRNVEFSGELL
ncbi:MAG: UDP-N-acetyl-D-glucosamine dehydrogenase [Actinomycetota bacterium]|jgi:nucleotide sugar dehydrogenase|nr:UDP-N-acetyl-D-glucosamine dehydrogenase [Actinomycetota bacterium]